MRPTCPFSVNEGNTSVWPQTLFHSCQKPHTQPPQAQNHPALYGPCGLTNPLNNHGPSGSQGGLKEFEYLDHGHEGDSIDHVASHVIGTRSCLNRGPILRKFYRFLKTSNNTIFSVLPLLLPTLTGSWWQKRFLTPILLENL